ncbi:helix-turn-helix domain-containing protein [Neisseria shayeganii]|uniref:XRE family transcriptional regulator n=1 Tax=Neisseria shayeganii 871 TaxID=1032488 RepID=G4CG83_9NEIS|nr:helix-turn-helix domain-containing protein [Neisseria shayeganii]EGY53131.1 hypothetical protein HMPREF9371_0622 [Neisseria shayeganii 871]
MMQDYTDKINSLLHDAHMTRAELSRAIKIAPRNISRWNTHGIPQYAVAYLELKAEMISLRRQIAQMQKSPRD